MTTDYRLYWGDTHDNTYSTGAKSKAGIEPALERARTHLDFYSAAYYTDCADAFEAATDHVGRTAGKNLLVLEGAKPAERIKREWAEVQAGTKKHYEPGAFVTFPGYEWQGNGSSGDHNVSYFEEGPPVYQVDTLPELYECLRAHEAVAIPHHTAYRTGVRGKDWAVFDENLSPYAEVFSVHGCSETDEEWIGLRLNSHMGPGYTPGTYQAALDRGYHVGAICSTDAWGQMPGRYSHGLAACLATELTREAVWDALKNRRVYGVTGDRIEIDYRLNGAVMGSIIKADGKRSISVNVRGSDAIDRIEILRNGRVIHTHCHQGTWTLPASRGLYKMRIECGWGPRPDELPVRDHHWRGRLTLGQGRMMGYEPCWIMPQPSAPVCANSEATFSLVSSTQNVTDGWQNANIFEFEAGPDSPLAVEVNGLKASGEVRDFASASRELWFKDECVKMLADEAGIPPGSPERDDIYHHEAFKTKLHRAIPEAGYTASVAFEDDEPIEGEVNYRVRVEQRNGQRAWTSPVWVTQGK